MNHAVATIATGEDNRGLPIQQTTELEQMNLTVSAKFALLPRGRAISRLAWIPRTFVPYVGAGGGYGTLRVPAERRLRRLRQRQSRVQRHVHVATAGRRPCHVLGGTDIQVYRHLMLSFEGALLVAARDLDQDFIDFEPIDLGGFRFGAGIHFVF